MTTMQTTMIRPVDSRHRGGRAPPPNAHTMYVGMPFTAGTVPHPGLSGAATTEFLA